MGKSIQVTATGTAYSSPCKLLRIIVDPGTVDGSFALRDGGAAGREIAGCTKVAANGSGFFLELDHDCETDIHATIANCILYCVIR